jgi:hypothetical protein
VKPLTVAQLNALRVLLKKATKPAPLTAEEQRTKRNAARAQFRADSLAHAQRTWDAHYARLKLELQAITNGGPTLPPELSIGHRPTICTPRMQAAYHHHINTSQGDHRD